MSPRCRPKRLLQLVVEFVVRQRDDALGLAPFLGPHDRRAFARQRQNGERPGGQEMFFGAAFVVALVADRGDDGRLVVVPAVRGDVGLLADRRARAVGADQQARGERLAVGERDVDRIRRMLEAGHRGGAQIDAERLGLVDQRVDQEPVLDHVRERLALFHLAAEGEEGRAHRVLELRVGHHHVEDRLRFVRDRIPDADGLEQPAGGGRDGRSARVLGFLVLERGVGDGHA